MIHSSLLRVLVSLHGMAILEILEHSIFRTAHLLMFLFLE